MTPVTIPTLETERLILRAPMAADTKAMLSFLTSPRAEFYGGPMSQGEAWRKYAAYVGQWVLNGYGLFAITLRETGETIGMAGPFHPEDFPEPELSWLLSSLKFEGKGYATEACRAVLNHLFTDLGWGSVVSYIDTSNASSRALAKRLGAWPDPDTRAPISGCESFRHSVPEAGRGTEAIQ